jgi:hypothetical protein
MDLVEVEIHHQQLHHKEIQVLFLVLTQEALMEAAEVAAALELLEQMEVVVLVVVVVVVQKYQDGVFHQLMEHQVLHPADSSLVEVVLEVELVVLVLMVVEMVLVRVLLMELMEQRILEVEEEVTMHQQEMLVLEVLVLLLLDGPCPYK